MRGTTRYRTYLFLGIFFLVPAIFFIVGLALVTGDSRYLAGMPASPLLFGVCSVSLGLPAILFLWLMVQEGRRLPPEPSPPPPPTPGPVVRGPWTPGAPGANAKFAAVGLTEGEMRALLEEARRTGRAEFHKVIFAANAETRPLTSARVPHGMPQDAPSGQLKVVRCPTCGAPLEPPAGVNKLRCPYCGNAEVVF